MAYNGKQIKLARTRLDTYRVISVKNSVDYDPGALLEKREVEALCNKTTWEVIVVGEKETT